MSEVTISNLALSHLGDIAEVTSIRPPDGSVQAMHCARFYPMARNTLLEMGQWGFATRRALLAQVQLTGDDAVTFGTWRFAYALPSGFINALAVLPQGAHDDYETWLGSVGGMSDSMSSFLGVPPSPVYTPQPFAIETQSNGAQVILTNVWDAMLRFTALVTDTTKFSPLFVTALSYLLASFLAGPIIKGDEGAAAAARCLQTFGTFKGQASASDANQQMQHVVPAPSWIRGR